ncbi:unnamed protein product [Chilo suppressalis]|uniref:Uncharacterized protein n=1 Tax=Chilo suppressalis TaxID=168631 RepID=A0ABN8B958_CHISP|nr:unnamed protein product [Chilo suppressalis]
MANIAKVLKTQQALETKLLLRMNELEGKWNSTPQSKDDGSLTQLRQEFRDFKSEVWAVLMLLRDQVSQLLKPIDDIEMRHRKKYLLVGGIPETIEDLNKFIICLLNSKMDLDLTSFN